MKTLAITLILSSILGCNQTRNIAKTKIIDNVIIGNWCYIRPSWDDSSYAEVFIDSSFYVGCLSEMLNTPNIEYTLKNDTVYTWFSDSLVFTWKVEIINSDCIVLHYNDDSDTLERMYNVGLPLNQVSSNDELDQFILDWEKRRVEYYIRIGFITREQLEENKRYADEHANEYIIKLYDSSIVAPITREIPLDYDTIE